VRVWEGKRKEYNEETKKRMHEMKVKLNKVDHKI
jgi:hypothetical protein